MAALQISKTENTVAALVDLFLSPDFEPLQKNTSQRNLVLVPHGPASSYTFEADIEQQDDKPYDTDQMDQVRAIGRSLAQIGDELYQEIVARNQKKLKSIFSGDLSKKDVKDKAWASFKMIMDDSIKGTGVDAKMQLGAVLLVLRSFLSLRQEVNQLARSFAQKYIADRELNQALDNLSLRELD